jgi:Methyltransferase domain
MRRVAETTSPARKLRRALANTLKDLPREKRLLGLRSDVARWLGNRVFERGLQTAEPEIELDHFRPDCTHYVPSGWLDLRRALPKRTVLPTDVFVDFGSGKGRMVYQAAKYPFARVVGVEISTKLNELARENIERNLHRLACRNIDLVNVDAADFEIPDDMTVAYFFIPFTGETFEAVLRKIIKSLDRNPRRLRIIYSIPAPQDLILSTGRFELIRTVKRRPHDPRRTAVYASTRRPD